MSRRRHSPIGEYAVFGAQRGFVFSWRPYWELLYEPGEKTSFGILVVTLELGLPIGRCRPLVAQLFCWLGLLS